MLNTMPLSLLRLSKITLPALRLTGWRASTNTLTPTCTAHNNVRLQQRCTASLPSAPDPARQFPAKRRYTRWSSDEADRLEELLRLSILNYGHARWRQIAPQLSQSCGVLRSCQACRHHAIDNGMITPSQRRKAGATNQQLAATHQTQPHHVTTKHVARRIVHILQQTDGNWLSANELRRRLYDELEAEPVDTSTAAARQRKLARNRIASSLHNTLKRRSNLFVQSNTKDVIQLNAPPAAEYMTKTVTAPTVGWSAEQLTRLKTTFSSYLQAHHPVPLSAAELTAAAAQLSKTVQAVRIKLHLLRGTGFRSMRDVTLSERSTMEQMVQQGHRLSHITAAVPQVKYGTVKKYVQRYKRSLQGLGPLQPPE